MRKIIDVQDDLIFVGIDVGVADGIMGPKTKSGLLAFEFFYSVNLLISKVPTIKKQVFAPWLKTAFLHLNHTEIKGKATNPHIVKFWREIGLPGIKNDETAWCAAFMGSVLETNSIRSTRRANARSYTDWGHIQPSPSEGSIVTFWRKSIGSWQGHVGFVLGQTVSDKLVVLGANQGDAVSIEYFDKSRVLSYSWPKNVNFDEKPLMFLTEFDNKMSTNEV